MRRADTVGQVAWLATTIETMSTITSSHNLPAEPGKAPVGVLTPGVVAPQRSTLR